MVAFIDVANVSSSRPVGHIVRPISLEDNGTYWFLYRYFEAANLSQDEQLIDLYGGREIEGYQLRRLRQELEQALEDVQPKAATWNWLVGWKGGTKSAETENWVTVQKDDVLSTIASLLELVRYAETTGGQLVSSGD